MRRGNDRKGSQASMQSLRIADVYEDVKRVEGSIGMISQRSIVRFASPGSFPDSNRDVINQLSNETSQVFSVDDPVEKAVFQ